MQLGFWTFHISSFSTTLEPTNKQSLSTSSCYMHEAVFKQMQTLLASVEICQKNPLDPKYNTPCFVCHQAWQNFDSEWSVIEHLILAKHHIRLRGGEQWFTSVFDAMFAYYWWATLVHCGNGAKQCSEQVPKPENKTIAYMEKLQTALLHWHYQMNHLSFRVLKTLATNGNLSRDCWVQGAQICSVHFGGEAEKALTFSCTSK